MSGNTSDFDVILLAAGCSRRLATMTKEIPKPFLPVRGKPIIERNLETLDAFGFRNVICVVGYLKEVFYDRLGDSYNNLSIEYVESLDYETTGHGWSLFQTREAWKKRRRPVILIHGDVSYDPAMLRQVIDAKSENAVSVDNRFEAKTNDEVLVYGTSEKITAIIHPSFEKVKTSNDDLLGECTGMNKWSAAYMEDLFAFMEPFFAQHGRKYNWEPVVNAFIPVSRHTLAPVLTEGLPWVNINYEEDLRLAEAIV